MTIYKKTGKIIFVLILFAVIFTSSPTNQARAASYDLWNLNTFPVIGYGYTTSGGFVDALQSVLWSTGYSSTVGSIDGFYGTATSNGIKAYQKRYGLSSDGIAGRQTWGFVETYTYNVDHLTRKFRNPNSTVYGTDFKAYATGAGVGYYTMLVNKTTGNYIKMNRNMWEDFR